MRYLIFLLPFFLQGQILHVYDAYGNLNPLPRVTIEKQLDGSKKVYNHNRFGVRNDQPTLKIDSTHVYRYNRFGVKQPMPIIKIDNTKKTNKQQNFNLVREPWIRFD